MTTTFLIALFRSWPFVLFVNMISFEYIIYVYIVIENPFPHSHFIRYMLLHLLTEKKYTEYKGEIVR